MAEERTKGVLESITLSVGDLAPDFEALRSALDPEEAQTKPAQTPTVAKPPANANLLDSFAKPKEGGVKISFLEDGNKH